MVMKRSVKKRKQQQQIDLQDQRKQPSNKTHSGKKMNGTGYSGQMAPLFNGSRF